MLFDNDTYKVFSESGGTCCQTSYVSTASGTPPWGTTLPAGDYVFDPHVVFDPTTDLWYASAIDLGNLAGATTAAIEPNNFLVAVSKTSDPTQGWTAFIIASDPTNATRADFDTLGFNSNSLVVTANMYDTSTGATLVDRSVLSIPLADLTHANGRQSTDYDLGDVQPSTSAISTFDAPLDYDATGGETLLAQSADGKSLLLQTITGGGGAGATSIRSSRSR